MPYWGDNNTFGNDKGEITTIDDINEFTQA